MVLINMEKTYIKTQSCIEEESDNLVVLFNQDTEMTHILNETASYMWENLMNEPFNFEDVINKFISLLDADEDLNLENVHDECVQYLKKMEDAGLILLYEF